MDTGIALHSNEVPALLRPRPQGEALQITRHETDLSCSGTHLAATEVRRVRISEESNAHYLHSRPLGRRRQRRVCE
jgi:hypothetical protein